MSTTEAERSVLERFRLDGKVAVVTGASAGLGVVFAAALAEAGADVALGARRADRLADTKATIERIGRRSLALATDVTQPSECEALVRATLAEFGRIDVLVNNAGTSDAVPALRQSPEDFRRVIDINLMGSYWMAQSCARVMQPGSSIVNISSVIGMTRGEVPSAGYAASKAAIIGLTRDLAGQWTPRNGIRVNALAPGYVATELTAPLIQNKKLFSLVLSRTPMRRLAEPIELCGPLIFLASDASSFVTGVTLPVDGGWTMS
jgi:NAD(P)-dependent dehydrogenase (short-subunit alcohol dehydrogenase family)